MHGEQNKDAMIPMVAGCADLPSRAMGPPNARGGRKRKSSSPMTRFRQGAPQSLLVKILAAGGGGRDKDAAGQSAPFHPVPRTIRMGEEPYSFGTWFRASRFPKPGYNGNISPAACLPPSWVSPPAITLSSLGTQGVVYETSGIESLPSLRIVSTSTARVPGRDPHPTGLARHFATRKLSAVAARSGGAPMRSRFGVFAARIAARAFSSKE